MGAVSLVYYQLYCEEHLQDSSSSEDEMAGISKKIESVKRKLFGDSDDEDPCDLDKFLAGTLSETSTAYKTLDAQEDEMLDDIDLNIAFAWPAVSAKYASLVRQYGQSKRRHTLLANIKKDWKQVLWIEYVDYSNDAPVFKSGILYCKECAPRSSALSVKIVKVDSNDLEDWAGFIFNKKSYCTKCDNALFFPIMPDENMYVSWP